MDNNQGVIDEIIQVFKELGYFVNAKQRAKTNGYNIPLEVRKQIGSDVYAVVGENPLTLYVSVNADKKLKKAIIGTPKSGGKSKGSSTTTKEVSDSVVKTETKTTLQYMVKDTIIDAIPVNVAVGRYQDLSNNIHA